MLENERVNRIRVNRINYQCPCKVASNTVNG